MAYVTPSTIVNGTLVNAEHYNRLVNAIEHLANLVVGVDDPTKLKDLASGANVAPIQAIIAGEYTGIGASGTVSVTGLGFSPDVVIINKDDNPTANIDNFTANYNGDTTQDSDGFTVPSNLTHKRINPAPIYM